MTLADQYIDLTQLVNNLFGGKALSSHV